MISVFIGGGLGALMRYLVCHYYAKSCSITFPFQTFGINVLGSFILGFLIYSFNSKTGIDNNMKLFLTVGLCGGFTTFSTFSLESVELFKHGKITEFLFYTFGSVIICLIGAALGAYFAKYV